MTHVVVIIVGYRNQDDIASCVAHLGQSLHRSFSVRICENGGEDAFRALLQALRDQVIWQGESGPSQARGHLRSGQEIAVMLAPSNLGYAGAINLSIGSVIRQPDWHAIWILNPDTAPDPGALGALVDRLAGGYGIVGGRLILRASNRVQMYGGRWRAWIARGYNIGLNQPIEAVPDAKRIEDEMTYVSGASMLVSRDYIDKVGLMDDRYFLYNEDVDWCFRRGAFRLGYAHDALILHAHGTAIGSSRTRRDRSALSVYLDERNKLLFTRKFYPCRYPIVAAITLLLTVQYLRDGAIENFFNAVKGWWAGVRSECNRPFGLT